MIKKEAKLIIFVLIAALLLPVFASCNGENGSTVSETGSVSETSGNEQEQPSEAASDETSDSEHHEGICVVINGVEFNVNAVNDISNGADVILLDRSCSENGKPVLYAKGSDEKRALISVKLAYKFGEPDYTVSAFTPNAGAGDAVPIPVNGFVLSVANSVLPESFKASSTSKMQVIDYEPLEYERVDLATVVPENRVNTRRINMLEPADGSFAEGKIYLCKSELTVPEGAVAVAFKTKSVGYADILRIYEAGETVTDADRSLVFTGVYNVEYAREFYSSGEVHFSSENSLNSISDSPAAAFAGGGYIIIPDSNVNAKSASDGVYLYNIGGNSAVTCGNGEFTNVVVRSGKVAYVSKHSENVVIPSTDGYVVTFAGASESLCDGIQNGDEVNDLLMESFDLPAMFLRVKSNVFEITAADIEISDTYPCILYSPAYGETTGTVDCAEIAVVDGVITEVSKTGNLAIPANGHVVSVKKGTTNYAMAANRTNEGDKALISIGGNMYSYSTFHYNVVNGVRQANYIVVYNNGFGESTKTNEYGYEFAVDKNGSITDSSYAGNMKIPEGGYVVSAHGTSIQTLEKAYIYGAKVEIDTKTHFIKVQATPESVFYDAEYRYNDLLNTYNTAKEGLLCLDYDSLDPEIERIGNIYKKILADNESNDTVLALEGSISLISACRNLRFSIYESAPVENRAVWYRCNEKSDDEVRASCELMAQMGVNAVYLETWYNGQFIGYSENPLIKHVSTHGDYDVLEGFCRIAHEYGIEVHCWVENFFIGSNGVLVDATKEYHLLDNKGKDYQPTMYGPFVFLDPLDDRSRKLVLDLYREILTKYDVDGLNLDYIRFPGNAEDGGDFGYNEDIIAAFKESTGVTMDPHKLTKGTADWLKWSRFKESIINEWVEVVYNMVREVKPGTSISCAVGSDYPNSRTDINQNFADWVDKGFIDEVFSMSYFSNLESAEKAMKTFTKYTKGKCFYTIGLSAFESSPDYILVGQVDMGIKRGNGSNLFSWGSLIKHEENYFDALKESIWSRPAARCDSGSKAVKAYCDRLIENSENVYKKFKSDQTEFLNTITSKAKEISDSAAAIDFEKLSKEERASYLASAINQMEELKTLAESCTDDQLKNKIVNQIQFIIDCLSVTR